MNKLTIILITLHVILLVSLGYYIYGVGQMQGELNEIRRLEELTRVESFISNQVVPTVNNQGLMLGKVVEFLQQNTQK